MTYLFLSIIAILLIFILANQQKNYSFIQRVNKKTENLQNLLKDKQKTIFLPSREPLETPNKPQNPVEITSPKTDIENIFLECNGSQITFKRIQGKLINAKEYTNTISAVTGRSIQLAPLLIQNATRGVYEASVSPLLLSSFQNGLTSTMVQGANGQIVAHAGFASAMPKVMTPLIVFQILSFVTAQYYLDIIQSNFKNLSRQLEDLKRFAKHEKLAELENIQRHTQRLSKIQYPQLEHLILVHHLEVKVGELVRYFANEIKYFDKPQSKETSAFVRKQLTNLEKDLYNDDFGFKIQMLSAAESAEQMIKSVALYLNCNYAQHETSGNRSQYIKELVNQILQLDETKTIINQEGRKITEKYFDAILEEVNKANPWFDSTRKERDNFIAKIKKYKQEILSNNNFKSSMEFREKLRDFWNRKHSVILVQSDDNEPVLFIKKQSSI